MIPSLANFGHPYQPYDIQSQFMLDLYQCIEQRGVGIFESPTGTGKSLSLICGALTWLRDHERQGTEHLQVDEHTLGGSDWLAAAERINQRRILLQDREDLEKRLAILRRSTESKKRALSDHRSAKKPKNKTECVDTLTADDEGFVLDEYHEHSVAQSAQSVDSVLSSSTQALLNQLQPKIQEEESEIQDRTKIIFCSRTHSQLTQFVNELRKVTPPSATFLHASDAETSRSEEIVKHLPLASRKTLCINSKVAQLRSTTLINERCMELQKPGIAKDKKCKYLPSRTDRELVESFRDRAIATIQDIEDLADLGRNTGVCPYYASRSGIKLAEVLTLPYPLLLQKSAREALGVQVKDNVIIIDEAHNLMAAIADSLSISLSLTQLNVATRQVTVYVQKFKNRLKGLNRVYVTQVIRMLNSLTDCLARTLQQSKQSETAVTAAELMSGKGVDQIKPHALLAFLVHSKLAFKVEGYAESVEDSSSAQRPRGVLMQVQSFLVALMNPDREGRFFVLRQDTEVVVRYILLDPREHFRDIVNEARAVILAGGTMSPMSDYASYLFSYLEPHRLKTFSFGHVIPKENLLADSVSSGPTGIEFDFTYGKRGSDEMIMELGGMIIRICQSTPDGVVVFFPSYDYLAQVIKVWAQKSAGSSIFQVLEQTKLVFEESRTTVVDDLLSEYAQAIDCGKGGLMLSVIGGKLSEGINFSDQLGRAVIAVGLPFPNIHGPEWKAKIEHVEALQYEQCKKDGSTEMESHRHAKAAGRDFYENACMRAVNQSIGRAIRHRNDFAAVIMADKRYTTQRIRSKLPHWIQSSMRDTPDNLSWNVIETNLVQFFKTKS